MKTRFEHKISLRRSMFLFIITLMTGLFVWQTPARAVRIKDLVAIKGVRHNQLIGYGLVMGLNGTGDKSKSEFTVRALANMMIREGIHVDKSRLKVKNVAAVIVTADLRPFARIGSRIDVVASSIGDATSLAGGTLILTPLHGVDGKVYALAQGAMTVGGIGAGGAAGGGATKNHLLAARIAGGATVEREIPMQLDGKKELMLSLLNPDFTTALRVGKTINAAVGGDVAHTLDSGTLRLTIPEKMRNSVAQYIGSIETLEVVPDMAAKIIVNEKTGTIVIGENVRISTVAISHGNLNITIKEYEEVSQPGILAQGETVTVKETGIRIEEDPSEVILIPEGATIGELVRALNAIGVTPRDLISIFQSIKASGALQAELVII
jgi:flagellar P-ring protein precursor FlgI